MRSVGEGMAGTLVFERVSPRARRDALLVIVGVLAVVLAAETAVSLLHPLGAFRHIGGDYSLYVNAARRWLAGGEFYPSWQFATYTISLDPGSQGSTAILYPPTALALLAPFSLLPAVLWWAIPLGIVAYCLVRARPSGLRLVALLVAAVMPLTFQAIANGNPMIWVVAFVVAGNRWGWPGAFVVLKPTFAPFALIGVRTRGWWLAAGALAVVSLAFLPMWLDYLAVLRNAGGPMASPLYSLDGYPWLALIWWGSYSVRTRNSTTSRLMFALV